MILFLILLICSLNLRDPNFAAARDPCAPASCDPLGPVIRFPFWLKGHQPESCGYSGYEISCGIDNSTVIKFQFPVRASSRNIVLPISTRAALEEIDYATQVITVSVLSGSCLPKQVPQVNSSASPFEGWTRVDGDDGDDDDGYTLFNCTEKLDPNQSGVDVTCLNRRGFHVYAIPSYSWVSDKLGSCVKMYNISDITATMLNANNGWFSIQLHWSRPFCGNCEERGVHCRWKSHGITNETGCFDELQVSAPKKKGGISKNATIAVSVVVPFLTTLATIGLCLVYRAKKREQESLRRIVQFLEDYIALRPSRYTYSDIKKITEGFKYRLGEGGYGTVYRGKLPNDIPVAVKVLKHGKGNGDDFINEVGTIGKVHHVNVVRLVGYCADGYRRALVYEFLEKDSLAKYISTGRQRKLGWKKVHEIALGIAKGLDYLHQGCNQRILHFDIKPQNILLDHNLQPKVADFGLAKLCSKDQSLITMTAPRGTVGYIAPEVFSRNFGKVSYKSDIYSFGMLLLDLVDGRKNFHAAAAEDSSQFYFPEWMYNQLEKGDAIAIQIDSEADSNTVKRLIIVGLWCIQWYPADRPSTKVVIQMLESENLPIMPPNPFGA